MPNQLTRRAFLAAGVAAAPLIVPSTVFGADAPSNRLAVGCIGVGNQGGGHLSALVS